MSVAFCCADFRSKRRQEFHLGFLDDGILLCSVSWSQNWGIDPCRRRCQLAIIMAGGQKTSTPMFAERDLIPVVFDVFRGENYGKFVKMISLT